MSKIEVNQISSQCGSTLTVGQSGDTVTLASGASQTGFGRTGTVDWDTTPKTVAFTAVSGNGYFVDTSSSAITVTLPASPSAGDIVSVADYANTFATNNLTVENNSSPINGITDEYVADSNGISLTFVYVDGTRGWKNINDGTTNATGKVPFIIATGGTVTTCGDCKIHTFTGPGTFTVCNVAVICAPTRNQVSYMVVAGGGSGGSYTGGGGGAGGFREDKSPLTPYTASPLEGAGPITVTATAFPITVGGGGAAPSTPSENGVRGNSSIFSTITSTGGGGGKHHLSVNSDAPGGSGGGGGEGSSGGSGNTPPTSPSQGENGGTGSGPGPNNDYYEEGGAGGGATAVGGNGTHNGASSANGGAGATTSISGSATAYAGGGGGGKGQFGNSGGNIPQGGSGGGGDGSYSSTQATAGTTNTGGGGGGSGASPNYSYTGKGGGSGIVIIRYKFQ